MSLVPSPPEIPSIRPAPEAWPETVAEIETFRGDAEAMPLALFNALAEVTTTSGSIEVLVRRGDDARWLLTPQDNELLEATRQVTLAKKTPDGKRSLHEPADLYSRVALGSLFAGSADTYIDFDDTTSERQERIAEKTGEKTLSERERLLFVALYLQRLVAYSDTVLPQMTDDRVRV